MLVIRVPSRVVTIVYNITENTRDLSEELYLLGGRYRCVL